MKKPIYIPPQYHAAAVGGAAVGLLVSFITVVAFAWTGRAVPSEASAAFLACLTALGGLQVAPDRRDEARDDAHDETRDDGEQ